MSQKQKDYTDKEAAKRRDDIVRAMIAMPPTPHKPAAKKKASRPKPATKTSKRKKPAK